MSYLAVWFLPIMLFLNSRALAQKVPEVVTVPPVQLEEVTLPTDAPELLFEERAAIAAVCKEGVWVKRQSLFVLYGLRIITLRSMVTCAGSEDYFLVKIHCDFLSPGRCQAEKIPHLSFQFEVEKRLYASKMRPQKK